MSNARPSVSFALFAHNHEGYVREAVESALRQTCAPLEIIISDDCSTDGTFDAVKEIAARYRGASRLLVNRNETNLGWARHINKVMTIATGDLIVSAAGDDISLPHRVERLLAYLREHPQCYSMHSNKVVIDRYGKELRTWIPQGQLPEACSLENIVTLGVGVLGATHAWRREVFDFFGPLDERVIREDAAIPFRSALLGDVCYLDEVLVRYRRHDSNLFKWRDQMISPIELHADWRLHATEELGLFDTMLSDLHRYVEKYPEMNVRFEGLEKRLSARRLVAQHEGRFVCEKSLHGRLMIAAKSLLTGVQARQVARWVLMQWLPRAYLTRIRRNAKKWRLKSMREERKEHSGRQPRR